MARKVKDVATLRVENLRLLIEQWGGPTTLAKKLQLSGPSYLSQLVSANRPITEKTARAWESKLDLPNAWLDRDHDGDEAPKAVEVSEALISRVVLAVGAALEDANSTVTPHKFSELVALVYEHARRGGVDEGYIKRLVKLVGKE